MKKIKWDFLNSPGKTLTSLIAATAKPGIRVYADEEFCEGGDEFKLFVVKDNEAAEFEASMKAKDEMVVMLFPEQKS